MKCMCGAWSWVLETRAAKDHMTIRRRHQCANDCQPFWTVQTYEAAAPADRKLAEVKRNAGLVRRNREARRMLGAGMQGKAVAAALGLSRAQVSRINTGKTV